ncbi:MAG: hypothetical protein HYS05_00240 [Acidobacteria bacterium]|nr:hypothetical protein [Acidobacteriota bacterium]
MILIAVTLVATASAQRRDRRLPAAELFRREALLRPYFELVRAYRHRDPSPLETIRNASLWPQDRLQKTHDLLREIQPNIYDKAIQPVDWKPIVLRAAAMLHTDAMFGSLDEGLSITPGIHRAMAVALVKLLEGPADRRFAARWFVVTTTILRWHNRPFEAIAHATDGLGQFPNAADLLLLAGTLHEDIARHDFVVAAAPMSGAERLNEAERHFRRSLAADAAQEEAQLHLGRVLHLRGQRAEAMERLTPIAERSGKAVLRYLAYLFLGAIYEDEAGWTEAERCYRAAIELQPREQSADVALSALFDRLGRRRDSYDHLVGALKNGPRLSSDPWWTYVFGPPQEMLLPGFLSLREEVME